MAPRSGCCQKWVRSNLLLLLTLVGIIAGVCLGVSLRQLPDFDTKKHNDYYDVISWIYIWGELFLRMLKMLILPLVMSCMVVGLTSLEGSAGTRLGLVSLLYIVITQLLGAIIGIVLAVTIRPGDDYDDQPPRDVTANSYGDVIGDFLRNLFPDNIVAACIQNVFTNRSTTFLDPGLERTVNNSSLDSDMDQMDNSTAATRQRELMISTKLLNRDGMNTLGVVMISVLLSFGIRAAGEEGRQIRDFFVSLNAVIFKIMRLLLWYAPVGLAGLIAGALLRVDDLVGTLRSLGLFVLVCVVGCWMHILVVIPLLYFAVTRKNPFKYYLHILDGLLAAIGPPASVAALPFLLHDCIEKAHNSPVVVKFFLPVAVTLNRDASAMFICSSVIFVAQSYGIDLDVGNLVILCLLVCLLSSAVASVPSSSVVILLLVSSAFNIPAADRVGLILAVDWLNDRMRTIGNVASTGLGAGIVSHICTERLRIIPGNPPLADDVNKEALETSSLMTDPETSKANNNHDHLEM